jgi:AcrR family transcriptional regulator
MTPVTQEKLAQEARPLRADARRNRERVLKAARVCFAEQGYDTQMADVAKKAKVGIGTVYRHFPDKTALVAALVEERFTEFASTGREVLEADDVWEGFRAWLMHCGEIQAEDRMICDFITEAVGADRVEAIADATGLKEVDEAVIEHAKAAGVLRADVVPEDIPTVMCGLGAIARVQDDPEGRVWRRQLEFMLEGMRTHP